MKPSIGRLVYYTDDNSSPPLFYSAAIITGLNEDGSVSLRVLYKNIPEFEEDEYKTSVQLTNAPAGSKEATGKWSWPVEV